MMAQRVSGLAWALFFTITFKVVLAQSQQACKDVRPDGPQDLRLKAMPSTSSIGAVWKPPANGGCVDYYLVYVRPANGSTLEPRAHQVKSKSIIISNLRPNTAYQVDIVAVNKHGRGPNSRQTLTTLNGPSCNPNQSPGPARNIKGWAVNGRTDKVTVNWQPPNNPVTACLTGYRLEGYDAKSGVRVVITTVASEIREISVNGLLSSTKYNFKVVPLSSTGDGTGFTISVTTNAPTPAPPAPVPVPVPAPAKTALPPAPAPAPAPKPAPPPSPKPAAVPKPQQTPPSAPQPAAQPEPQPAPQPAAKPSPRPAPQPAPQAAPQPTPQPAPQPAQQPLQQPAPQPAAQPAPAPQPATQPAPQPAPQLAPQAPSAPAPAPSVSANQGTQRCESADKPAAPQSFVATPQASDKITLQWVAGDSGICVDKYHIEGFELKSGDQIAEIDTPATQYTFAKLKTGVEYVFTVTGKNKKGESVPGTAMATIPNPSSQALKATSG